MIAPWGTKLKLSSAAGGAMTSVRFLSIFVRNGGTMESEGKVVQEAMLFRSYEKEDRET